MQDDERRWRYQGKEAARAFFMSRREVASGSAQPGLARFDGMQSIPGIRILHRRVSEMDMACVHQEQ